MSSHHQPRKRFGQNFLRDPYIIQSIVAAVAPQANEHLVEIGPGQGALTQLFIPACRQLDLIEIDRDLVAQLRQNFAAQSHVCIHGSDALHFDFSTLCGEDQLLRVVGNLPYNISTPLLFHLFSQSPCIQDMHFMLQKEVVDRLAATPDGKEYGRLSVMAQYHCQIEALFDVDPECFFPVPKVMSSIVRLRPYPQPPVDAGSLTALAQVVTTAFSQRRKTLRNTLKELFSEEEICQAGIDPKARAENVALEQFAALSKYHHDHQATLLQHQRQAD